MSVLVKIPAQLRAAAGGEAETEVDGATVQEVVIFDLKTLQPISKVKTTGENPDSILYDPSTRRELEAALSPTYEVASVEAALTELLRFGFLAIKRVPI